jgi:ABC-type sugar transport system permease subunit
MKDINKVLSTGITGIISGLYAGVESFRFSIIETFCTNVTDIAEAVSVVIALITTIISLLYVYYKMQNEKRKFENDKKDDE